MNTTTTIPLPNQQNDADGQPKTELEARDRIQTLIHFLRAQLDHAKQDFDTTTEDSDGPTSKVASLHGFCALEIAMEYLDEMAKLEERDIVRSIGTKDRIN